MKQPRNRPSFFREVGFSLVLCLVAAAATAALSFVLPNYLVVRAVIAALGLAYVMHTIAGSQEKTGRIVTLVVWFVAASLAWFGNFGLPAYLAFHVTLIWLTRSLYLYSSLVEPTLDFGLTMLAVCFAAWAAIRTDSLFLSSWCFFLIQALHVAIPGVTSRFLRRADARQLNKDPDGEDPNGGFVDARNAADEALHRIAARN